MKQKENNSLDCVKLHDFKSHVAFLLCLFLLDFNNIQFNQVFLQMSLLLCFLCILIALEMRDICLTLIS